MRYYNQNFDVTGADAINSNQKFVAVGPAVGPQSYWNSLVQSQLALDPGKSARYKHDPLDPVKYLTSPRSPVDIGRGIYYGVKSPSAHVLANPKYLEYLQTKDQNSSQSTR